MKVLVVAAHPDDEVLGCGGTIAHYTRKGHEVAVIICCRRRVGLVLVNNADDALYQAAARKAAEILGYKHVWFFGLPDEQLWRSSWNLMKRIEWAAGEFLPDLVLTHAGSDYNQDHRTVYDACRIVFRPWGKVKGLLSFYVPSGSSPSFSPNFYVGLSQRDANAKMRAWEQAYQVERRDSPHPRSNANLQMLLMSTGESVGLSYAEGFQVEYMKEEIPKDE